MPLDPKALAQLQKIRPVLPKVAQAASKAFQEIAGDVWSFFKKPNTWVVVPTSADRQLAGQVARQAAEKIPGLAKLYAEQADPLVIAGKSRLILFPTRPSLSAPADLSLIERNLGRIREAIDSGRIQGQIAMPQIGTGEGGLRWEQVQPVVTKHLAGKNIVLVKPAPNLVEIYPSISRVVAPGLSKTFVPAAPRLKRAPAEPSAPRVISRPVSITDQEMNRVLEAQRKVQLLNRAAEATPDPVKRASRIQLSDTLETQIDKMAVRAIAPQSGRIAHRVNLLADEIADRSWISKDPKEGNILQANVRPIAGGAQTSKEFAQQKFFEWTDRSVISQALGGTKVGRTAAATPTAARRLLSAIHPQRLAREDPFKILPNLYNDGLAFIDVKDRLYHDWSTRLTTLLKPISREEFNELPKILQNQAAPGNAKLATVTQEMRQYLDDFGRYLGILKDKVGETIHLDLTGKLEPYMITKVDSTARQVTVRGLVGQYIPRGRGRHMDELVLSYEQAFPKYLQDYFPHIIRGDWWVVNPAAEGSPQLRGLYKRAFQTWDDAAQFIRANFSDEQIVRDGVFIQPRLFLPDDAKARLSRQAIYAIGKHASKDLSERLGTMPNMPEDFKIGSGLLVEALRGNVRVAPSLRFFGNLLPRRLNLETYERDFLSAMDSYIRAGIAKTEGDKWRLHADALLHGDAIRKIRGYNKLAFDPETIARYGRRPAHLYKWFSDWAEAIDSSRPSSMETWVDDLVYEVGGSHSWAYRRSLHFMGQVMSALKLSSPTSALVNMSQTALTTWPVLGKHTFTGMAAIARLQGHIDQYGNEIRALQRELGIDLYVSRAAIDSIRTRSRFFKENGLLGLLWMFNKAEFVNRAIAGVGGYYFARERTPQQLVQTLIAGGMRAADVTNLSHHQLAVLWAKRWSLDFTQFRYGVEAVPALLRNPTARLFFQFKPFLLNFLNFVLEIHSPSRAGRIAGTTRAGELVRFYTAIIGGAGLLGLPFTELIDKQIQKHTGWSYINELKKHMPERVYNVPLRGVGALFGWDLSSRIGFGADVELVGRAFVDPGKISVEEAARISPWSGMIMDFVSAIKNFYANRTEDAADLVIQKVAPLQMWYLYYGTKQYTGKKWALFGGPSGYVQPGEIRSPLKGGAKITTLPRRDPFHDFMVGPWSAKIWGVRTVKESEVSEEAIRQEVEIERLRVLNERYRRQIVQAFQSGNWQLAQEIALKAQQVGADLARLEEEFKQAQRGLLTRTIRRLPAGARGEAVERSTQIEEDLQLPGGRRSGFKTFRGF